MCIFKSNKKKGFSHKSLKDEIITIINSCYMGNIDASSLLISDAKRYLLLLFAKTNESFSSIVIKMSSLKNVDITKIKEWQKEYELFTNNTTSCFSEKINTIYRIYLTGEPESFFREIIIKNNSF